MESLGIYRILDSLRADESLTSLRSDLSSMGHVELIWQTEERGITKLYAISFRKNES
jgi:hypothetical protein